METQRMFLAIFLSLVILIGYKHFFAPPVPVQEPVQESVPDQASPPATAENNKDNMTNVSPSPVSGEQVVAGSAKETEIHQPLVGRDIKIETSLYSAEISEVGAGFKTFKLKEYKESIEPDSKLKDLITAKDNSDRSFAFTWGSAADLNTVSLALADAEELNLAQGAAPKTLNMKSKSKLGLEINRTFIFHADDYQVDLQVEVYNPLDVPVSGAPQLKIINRPFSESNNSFIFMGPAIFANNSLEEIDSDDFEESAKIISTNAEWVAYEDTYFLSGVILNPQGKGQKKISTISLSKTDTDKTHIVVAGQNETLAAKGRVIYQYKVFVGPKQISELKKAGSNLERIVDFGWFDMMAKPTLHLLNFLYGYLGNYGLAIILVTVIIKLIFWPISQKGMKSMKNMQKLQPKMAKLREKYKDDRERLSQEMMSLYKTYKINPLGGCLPMVLQIPVFFALYKVLLQTIELRHSPFFLWITDLSAPDRLYIGFDLPYLGGLPVLTLLMGASMFLQQKMSPTAMDPAQAKVMMFMPVIFTFMFLNFASGLVLYWFINNLLSVLQQYMINKQTAAEG
jgi:YidC/Oxa1 family membrane protein insertase